MFNIRPYEQNTKQKNYDYMYKEYWYKNFEDLFEKEFLIYPTNMTQEHWFLIVVFLKNKEILYYDSCGYDQSAYLDYVEKSLVDEAKKRNRLDFTTASFKKSAYQQTPKQENGYDCGVFLIMMINFMIDKIPLSELKQEDMPAYRLILACDIIRQKMNYYTLGK
jgi:sentrin-specific protease 1